MVRNVWGAEPRKVCTLDPNSLDGQEIGGISGLMAALYFSVAVTVAVLVVRAAAGRREGAQYESSS
jgi:hypothetical protein